MGPEKKIVEIQGVRKIYEPTDKRATPVHALENVTIDIRQGEFISIVGQSGCGKSTILKIVAGLVPCSSGSVVVNGSLVTRPIAEVGIVFQNPVLLQWRKVLGNIMLPVEILGLDKNKYLPRAHDLISLVGLKGFEDKYPFELSGGMQQRVSICRALIHDPPVLIMDEPFSALDEITRDAMNMELLRIWTEAKKSILYITHGISEAVFLADRVAVMSPRPGTIIRTIDIDLDRPRDLSIKPCAKFAEYVERVRKEMGLVSGCSVENRA